MFQCEYNTKVQVVAGFLSKQTCNSLISPTHLQYIKFGVGLCLLLYTDACVYNCRKCVSDCSRPITNVEHGRKSRKLLLSKKITSIEHDAAVQIFETRLAHDVCRHINDSMF